jgi:hypothetical protein
MGYEVEVEIAGFQEPESLAEEPRIDISGV